jgi:hypothetical protein
MYVDGHVKSATRSYRTPYVYSPAGQDTELRSSKFMAGKQSPARVP